MNPSENRPMQTLIAPGRTNKTPTLNKLPSAVAMGAVLYTDGGCKPNPGNGGWGIHGYIYSTDAPTKGNGCKKGFMSTWGYLEKAGKNDKPITILRYIDGHGSMPEYVRKVTNNEAELLAAIKGLERFKTMMTEYPIERIVVLADSKYVLDGISEWVPGWKNNGWVKKDGGIPSNLEEWKQLDALVSDLEAAGVTFDWRWVRGHNGEIGNTIVDYWASAGVIAGKKRIHVDEIEESDVQGYWNKEAEYNRLFSHPKWYFNTSVGGSLKSFDGRNIYHLGNHGKDDVMLGKPISDGCYSVLFTKEAFQMLEELRSLQDEHAKGYVNVVIGRLDYILRGETFCHLKKYGTRYLEPYGRSGDLIMPDELPLTNRCYPPRIANDAIEALGTLQLVLEDFLKGQSHAMRVTEITDQLYEVEDKKNGKNKLKKTITSATKALKVDAGYWLSEDKQGSTEVPLTVGIDIPDRNTLSAISETNPKVFVVTWRESDVAFRYATVLQNSDDVGIWAGVYSNLRKI